MDNIPRRITSVKTTDTLNEFVDWLYEYCDEPLLLNVNAEELSKALDLETDEDKDYNLTKITYAILCNGMNGGRSVQEEVKDKAKRTQNIIRLIRNYIPKRFRESLNKNYRWYNKPDYYQEAIDRFDEWYIIFCKKIEMELAENYYTRGRMNYLEILKRRFRERWTESKIVDLTAEQNVKVDSGPLEIIIKDA